MSPENSEHLFEGLISLLCAIPFCSFNLTLLSYGAFEQCRVQECYFPSVEKLHYEFTFCPLDPKFCILEYNQPHIMWYYNMCFMKNNLCTSGLLQFKLILFMGQLYSTLFWKWPAFCKSQNIAPSYMHPFNFISTT